MGTESTVLVSPEQFIAARNRLVGTIRETPTTLSHSLSQRFGRDVYLKRRRAPEGRAPAADGFVQASWCV